MNMTIPGTSGDVRDTYLWNKAAWHSSNDASRSVKSSKVEGYFRVEICWSEEVCRLKYFKLKVEVDSTDSRQMSARSCTAIYHDATQKL